MKCRIGGVRCTVEQRREENILIVFISMDFQRIWDYGHKMVSGLQNTNTIF